MASHVFSSVSSTAAALWGVASNWQDTMCEAIDRRLFADNAAIGGGAFYTIATANTRRGPASAAGKNVWSSALPSSVVYLDSQPAADVDPFGVTYPHWPLEGRHPVVHQIAEDLKKKDPPLFTPLLPQQDRYQALQRFRGQRLNCLGTDHSFRHYSPPSQNASHVLKQALATDGALWHRWQKRMRSIRLTRSRPVAPWTRK